MRSAGTYIFDAVVNILGQSVLFLIGAFICWDIFGVAAWLLAAAGFAVLLSVMERGAELRRGADFRHYVLFSVLPVNVIALVAAVVSGIIELNLWFSGPRIYLYTPYYPLIIGLGSIGITACFAAVNQLTRRTI